jgi:tetratricopeptide (TPR) repeat protein
MHPENLGANPGLEILVAEYEAMRKKGENPYLGEETFFKLIGYYEGENQLTLALGVVENALLHFSFSSDFYLKKAQLLIGIQRDKEALDTLQQAEIFAPSEPGIQLLRAEVLAYDGQHEEALALLADFKGQIAQEELDDFFFTEALVYECQNRFEAMYYSLVKALQCNPDHTEALERLGISIEVTRKYEESIPLLHQILDHNAYAHLAWYLLGHAYAYMGDYPQAIEAYEYAFLSQPSFEGAYRDCADLCLQMQRFQPALNVYKDIMDQFGPDADLYFQMGQCYQALDQPQSARALFQEALRLDPLDDEILFHIGLSWLAEEKFAQAVRFLTQAIQLESKRSEYYSALGEAFCCQEKWDEAEENFRQAIRQSNDNPNVWLDLVSFYLDLGRMQDAEQVLEEATLFTESVELLYSKVATLFYLGRRKEGLYWLGEALEEGFEIHYRLFDFNPELQQDPGVAHLINSYLLH